MVRRNRAVVSGKKKSEKDQEYGRVGFYIYVAIAENALHTLKNSMFQARYLGMHEALQRRTVSIRIQMPGKSQVPPLESPSEIQHTKILACDSFQSIFIFNITPLAISQSSSLSGEGVIQPTSACNTPASRLIKARVGSVPSKICWMLESDEKSEVRID